MPENLTPGGRCSEMNAEQYRQYRKVQIEDGQLFQDFVVDLAWQAGLAIAQYASKTYQIAIGESRTGVEIKYDKRRAGTGNLYIEYAEKAVPRLGDYAPSGIMRTGHWLFAIGDYDIVYFFANSLLLRLKIATNGNGGPRYRHVQSETSQGYLLPERDAKAYAALVLAPNASGRVQKMVGDLRGIANELHQLMSEPTGQLSLFGE